MSSANQKLEDLVIDEFYRIKEDLGHVLSRVEMFTYIDEENLVDIFTYDFIKFIENTRMSKTYKMSVFLAFYNSGDMKLEINDNDLYKSFKEFFSKGSN